MRERRTSGSTKAGGQCGKVPNDSGTNQVLDGKQGIELVQYQRDPGLLTETPASNSVNLPIGFRHLFYAHVLALVVTALVVIPLLLGIASIPTWVALAYCAVIAVSASVFVFNAVLRIRSSTEKTLLLRLERLTVLCGLALAQFIFVLPVLICVCAPSLRL